MPMIQAGNTARREIGDSLGQGRLGSIAAGPAYRPGNDEGSERRHGQDHATIVLIERRILIRDCLLECFAEARSGEIVQAFASASDWVNARPIRTDAPLILLSIALSGQADIEREIAVLSQADPCPSIVLIGDGEDAERVLGALDKGARGYISTSMSFDVAVKAIQLVRAGGTFVPAECLRAPKPAASVPPIAPEPAVRGLFTTRQLAVIEALRQGKANKTIAFELNLRESTVKVHVRNIMKKLRAKNRTEVAFRVSVMAPLA
jgi:DNA-binding NarL/FixJ family response regulator